jgi:hypothetical protein
MNEYLKMALAAAVAIWLANNVNAISNIVNAA